MDSLNRRIAIDACRNHHRVLRDIVDEFPSAEPVKERDAVSLLVRLRSVLYRHLRLEDAELYPALQIVSDSTVRRKARRYQLHMGSLSKGFDSFYTQWTREGSIEAEPQRFLSDWKELKDALLMRMESEDEDLYAIAERLCDTTSQAAAGENPQ